MKNQVFAQWKRFKSTRNPQIRQELRHNLRLICGRIRASFVKFDFVVSLKSPKAPVAQMDRVQPSEGWGRTFESCLAHHIWDSIFNAYPSREINLVVAQLIFLLSLPLSPNPKVVLAIVFSGNHYAIIRQIFLGLRHPRGILPWFA